MKLDILIKKNILKQIVNVSYANFINNNFFIINIDTIC